VDQRDHDDDLESNHDDDSESDHDDDKDSETEASCGQKTEPSIVLVSKIIGLCLPYYIFWLFTSNCTKERGVNATVIGRRIGCPKFVSLIGNFLQQQPDVISPPPHFNPVINTYPSAKATFYAPSDISQPGGMCQELIRAVSQWRKGASRYDTVFLKLENDERDMQAFGVARVRLFFTFLYLMESYQCALVDDFVLHGDRPDEDTGMWKVKRSIDFQARQPISRVVYLKTILRASHLIPVFAGTPSIATDVTADTVLDSDQYRNKLFYVNKFVDYHAFETVF
jgi:hypothetical protein